MTKTMKKNLALVLVLVQIFALFPSLQPQAQAAQTDPETPALNKTIVGTVNFQSFNFLGDNDTGEDGTDYSTTFYYTDDYFAPSAINDAATSRTMLWSDLDNPSLAACSMDFAVASYTSAEGDVIRASSQTWNNTNYSGTITEEGYTGNIKERNVRKFLNTCGFSNVECNGLNERPTNDSIGYTLGSKQITVWNADTQKNETYTLIAVGCRGAGYGAEWASNITIGDPSTNAIPANGRHYGFDHSAQIVCDGIRDYLTAHSITGKVKYWVTGFSRAAAVANLVAGYLTDDGNTYKTQQKDVFGYTWECPQAAKTANTNFTNYKNIHNILNPMDAVPKVSPDAFEHQRLGVDYQMPYHDNVSSTSQNTTLYNQMYNVLKTIAVGNGSEEDPLIETVNPSNYPYNKVMTIYKMDGSDLMGQVVNYGLGINEKLLTEFGTVEAEQEHKGGFLNLSTYGNVGSLLGWNGGSDYKTTTWYLDDFINNLVTVFLTSNAWVGGTGNGRTALQNRATFISNYQNDFRTLFGYFLDFSGPAFLGMMPKLIDAVTSNIGTSLTSGFAWDFVRFYNDPSNTSKKNNLISSSKTLSVNVANDMVTGYPDPEYQGITKAQMNAAMQNLAELVINLYSYELSEYDSQYLGTTLRYLNTILCTHEQETVLSWIMSLDPNHMNRSARTLTVPKSAEVTLYEFRDQYEEALTDGDTTAQIVAFWKDGALNSKDGRITKTESGNNVIIRYPASLKIRADVKAAANMNLNQIQVNDYQTKTPYTMVSDSRNTQYVPAAASLRTLFNNSNGKGVTSYKASNANTAMTNYGSISTGDTLHILVNDMTAYNSENTKYELSIDKSPDVTVLDYAKGGAGGVNQTSAFELGVSKTENTTTDNTRTIPTRQKQITVPASCVYFDDELTRSDGSDYVGNTTRIDSATESKTVWYKFRGTRIDAYCTTDDTAGYVQAAVTDENGNIVTNAAGERMIVTMKSASDTTRYNVPTISFDGLDANTDYYLKINALKGANYRLDGIRVYHSADETDAAVQTVYESVGEQDAKYVNLRALLLGSVSEDTLSGDDANVAEGALFYTDSDTSYALTSDEYLTNSPKNEIYLKNGECVAFQIVGTYEKVAVGMSAPDTKTGGGSVTVTNGSGTKTQPIANALDTYYEINPATDGSVVIENTGSAMISITNVKLSGDYTAPVSGQSLDVPLTVSKSLIRYAASFSTLADTTPAETAVPEETTAPTEEPAATQTPEPTPSPTPTATPEPTPTPTNPSSDSSVMQLISSFVKSLFGGFSRLFRP